MEDAMPTADEVIPADYRDLLERPLYGHLATVRQDGTVQVEPMWFEFDGEFIQFTHTSKRQKYRNLMANPSAALRRHPPPPPVPLRGGPGVAGPRRPGPGGGVLPAAPPPLRPGRPG